MVKQKSLEEKAAQKFFQRIYSGKSKEIVSEEIKSQADNGVVYIQLEFGDLDDERRITLRGQERIAAYVITAKAEGHLPGQYKVCVSSDKVALYLVSCKNLEKISQGINNGNGDFKICLDSIIPGSCVNEEQRYKGILPILENYISQKGYLNSQSIERQGNCINIRSKK